MSMLLRSHKRTGQTSWGSIEWLFQMSRVSCRVVMLTVCVGTSRSAPTGSDSCQFQIFLETQKVHKCSHFRARRLFPCPLGPVTYRSVYAAWYPPSMSLTAQQDNDGSHGRHTEHTEQLLNYSVLSDEVVPDPRQRTEEGAVYKSRGTASLR